MNGKAIIISAPSGAGKTSILTELTKRIPTLKFSVSVTTRKPRKGEVEGKDYYFVSNEDFKRIEEDGELLEWEEVYQDVFYGTLTNEVNNIWDDGNQVIFDIDVAGGLSLKKIFREDALSIFIKVKSEEVLKERLQKRQTDSEETIKKRIGKAVSEMAYEEHFDKVILNDDFETAVNEAEKLVREFIA